MCAARDPLGSRARRIVRRCRAALVGVVVALPRSVWGPACAGELAFGLLADNVGFQFAWSGNGDTGSASRAPDRLAQFHERQGFFVLAFVASSFARWWCSRSARAPRRELRHRAVSSPAASIGTNLVKLKITVFASRRRLPCLAGPVRLLQARSRDDFNSLLFWCSCRRGDHGVYTWKGDPSGNAYVILYQVLDYLLRSGANLFRYCRSWSDYLRAPPEALWNGRAARDRARCRPAQASRGGRLTWLLWRLADQQALRWIVD